MKSENINDSNYVNSKEYQDYLAQNPGIGYLKVRVYTASEALPISNLKIVVSKVIADTNVVFFEGYSDASGIFPMISLPAPKIDASDLNIPVGQNYLISAIYTPDNLNETFEIKVYENVTVVQNINVVLNKAEA